MPAYTVRHAHVGDAPGYIDLIKGVLAEQPRVDTPYTPDEFAPPVEHIAGRISEVRASDNSLFLVAAASGVIIGALTCAGGTLAADHHVTSMGMYVAKPWRDQGVGKALLDTMLAWAQTSPVIRRIELEVFAGNRRALHLYEKYGFEIEGRKRKMIYLDGAYIDNLIMARLLEKSP